MLSISFLVTGGRHVRVPKEVHVEAEKYAKVFYVPLYAILTSILLYLCSCTYYCTYYPAPAHVGGY